MALGKIVRQILRREAEEKPPPKPARRSPLEDLEQGSISLEDVLRHKPESLGAVLHIVTVRKIREILGEEWPVYAQKIYALADRLFQRHLGSFGIYAIHEEDTFLFSFGATAKMKPEEEEAKSQEVASDLMRWLIGDTFAGAEIGIAKVATADARNPDGSLNANVVETARAQARIIRAVDVAPEGKTGGGGVSGQADGKGDGAPGWRPLAWPPDGMKRGQDPVLDIALPPDLRLGFRPVWQARNERLDLAICEPLRLAGEDGRPAPLAVPRNPDAAAALELAVMKAALEQMEREIERRSGLTLIVPLSMSTVTGAREALATAIAEIAPAGARGRHLFIELRGVSEVPQQGGSPLPQLLARLRGLSRDVLLDCGDVGDAAILTGLMPLALGTRLRPKVSGPAAAAHNATELRRLAQFAESLPLYLWGVAPALDLPAGLRRRLVFASGPAAGGLAPEPPVPKPLPAATLLGG